MPPSLSSQIRMIPWPLVALLLALTACDGGTGGGGPITCEAGRRDFVSSVAADGVVEAHRKHVLTVPRVRGIRMPEISFLAPEGSWVEAGQVVVEFSDEVIRSNYDDAVMKLADSRAEVTRLEVEHESRIAQLKAEIGSASASAAAARLRLAELEFAAPRQRKIQELGIERSLILASRSRKKLTSLHEVHREELKQKQLQVRQAQNKIAIAQENLDKIVLKAPVAGYTLYETNWITREKVQQGNALYANWAVVSIPDISALQVKLQLSETDVQGMEVGQEAELVIPSLGDLKLNGRVSSVAKVAKPVSRGSDVKAVETIVSIDSLHQGLVPGLSALCTVYTFKQEQAVVIPLETIFAGDSAQVVYAFSGDSFTETTVILGARGEDFAVVDSGLAGGEHLALRKPDESLIAR